MPSWAIYGNERRRGILLSESGAAVQQFLNRIAAQDGTHTTAYTDLINGLVADGIWDKIQCLYVFAAAESATALTNLKTDEAFDPAVATDAPTFTADVGYAGENSSTRHIKTGYTNSTHGSQNSFHMMLWNNSNTSADFGSMGAQIVATDNQSSIYPKYASTSKHYGRVNNDTGIDGVAVANPTGMLLANRSGASTQELYFNGVDVNGPEEASATMPNLEIYICAINKDGTADSSAFQLRAASIGTSLTSTEAADYHTHLAAYMAAIDA
jgi:hypothetical protein